MHSNPEDPITNPASDTTLVDARPIQRRDFNDAPLKKLTINLLKTYKTINTVYYEAKRKRLAEAAAAAKEKGTHANPAATTAPLSSSASAAAAAGAAAGGGGQNDGHDDENHDYVVLREERLNGRYVVKSRIGKGSFGVVCKAWDETKEAFVAIKIIKSKKPFFKQAQVEIELLHLLNQEDPEDQNCVVRLLDTFEHHKHQCLVFEMLSFNLYDLLRNTGFKGVSLDLIRKFARQILKGLAFLSQPHIQVIHCDLKPENILLRHPRRSAIKIIDFGSSCRSSKRTYTYIQSRFYRSPEVMLGCAYSCAIDMWSLGCILVEMHTGEPLFAGQNEHNQMELLIAARGMPPDEMLQAGKKTSQFFECVETSVAEPAPSSSPSKEGPPPTSSSPRQFWRFKPAARSTHRGASGSSSGTGSSSRSRAPPAARLEYVLGMEPNSTSGPFLRRRNEPGHSIHVYRMFIDLVDKMLIYNPADRITPEQALAHPFINETLADSSMPSVAAARIRPSPSTSRSGVEGVALPQRPGSC